MFDWFDGAEEYTEGLGDVDPSQLNRGMFEIEAGLSTRGLTETEVDNLHERIEAFTNEKRVAVRVSSASDGTAVYTFDIRSRFLDVER